MRSMNCSPMNSSKMPSAMSSHLHVSRLTVIGNREIWFTKGRWNAAVGDNRVVALWGNFFCRSRQRMVEEGRRLRSRPRQNSIPCSLMKRFRGVTWMMSTKRFAMTCNLLKHMICIVTGTDVTMLKPPIGDSPPFLQTFHHQKIKEFDALCSMLKILPHVHVACCLFPCGGTVSTLQWWCRTTPRAHLSHTCLSKISMTARNKPSFFFLREPTYKPPTGPGQAVHEFRRVGFSFHLHGNWVGRCFLS